MDYKKLIADIVVKNHGVCDKRLRMIYKEFLKSFIDKSQQETEQLFLLEAKKINKIKSGVFFENVSDFVNHIGIDISIQRAGQLMASIGVKKTKKIDSFDLDQNVNLVEKKGVKIKTGYYYFKNLSFDE